VVALRRGLDAKAVLRQLLLQRTQVAGALVRLEVVVDRALHQLPERLLAGAPGLPIFAIGDLTRAPLVPAIAALHHLETHLALDLVRGLRPLLKVLAVVPNFAGFGMDFVYQKVEVVTVGIMVPDAQHLVPIQLHLLEQAAHRFLLALDTHFFVRRPRHRDVVRWAVLEPLVLRGVRRHDPSHCHPIAVGCDPSRIHPRDSVLVPTFEPRIVQFRDRLVTVAQVFGGVVEVALTDHFDDHGYNLRIAKSS
jgi:hypothetical protein